MKPAPSPDRKNLSALIISLIILAGVLPVLLYWLIIGRAPTVTVQQASGLLNAPASNTILVDVRSAEEFKESHLAGAKNWPYQSILVLESKANMPEQFKDKSLLLICGSGISSAVAARSLQQLSITDVFNVGGGMQLWIANAENLNSLSFSTMRHPSGEISQLPFRESPKYKQWLAVIAGFVIKPTYMLLSLLLNILLWPQKSPDLAALRWGLIAFLLGETFCSVNYLFFNEQSLLVEYFHSYGMALCMGLTVFALLEGLDRRVVKYTDPQAKCVWLGLCRSCAKYKAAPCGLNRLFKLTSPALIILAVMPLNAAIQPISYNTEIVGTFYNYTHAGIQQLYEIRYGPIMAIVLLAISFLVLPRKAAGDVLLAKIFLAAGLGHLGFSFLRLILLSFYSYDMVWFVFWEEATELLFVASVGFGLWIFREGLLKPGLVRRSN